MNETSQRPRRALITGMGGQDGSYLCDLLLERGYEVHGTTTRFDSSEAARGAGAEVKVHLADMTDMGALVRLLKSVEPTEIYHLAAQSHVGTSLTCPVLTADVTGLGTMRLLEAVRTVVPSARVCHASSAEIFAQTGERAQNETTPQHPRNPYGAAKVMAHWSVVNWRESYGLFACNAILYNHESPRRGANFVTRKITRGAAAISLGLQDKLFLGNLDARRDWGWAPDYVEAMWRMLQHDTADDYVVSTGRTHSVREFCDAAFRAVGLDYTRHVEVDARFLRPADEHIPVGDASKIRRVLGWEPSVSFEEMVARMVEADVENLTQQKVAR